MPIKKCRYCNSMILAKGLCKKHYFRKYWKTNRNRLKLKKSLYLKTQFGFLTKLYKNMKDRVSGTLKNSAHLYKGKPILPKSTFYKWAISNPKYIELYNVYVASGYDRKLAPSIDRINPDKGYTMSNIEWVTNSENCRRASITKLRLRG